MGKQSLRIAMICTEMLPVPPIRGGAVQILIQGAASYLSKKHRVTIYSISDPDLADREFVDGIEYVRLPADGYEYRVGMELARLRKTKLLYDVIHVFNRPRNVLIYKSAMPESRFVLSLHNEMYRDGKISLELGRLTIRALDRIMSISDYIGRTIAARFPAARRKLRTVYSGIDLERYAPAWTEAGQALRDQMRKKYGLEGKKVVLFVGRLSAVKGPDVLIRGMEPIFAKYPESVLVIVGSKWFHDEKIDEFGARLRRLAEPFGDRIRFTGFVPPDRLPEAFLLGDVFVCSSQWQEPLARVHYEAMGAGLPVVTTNRGGNGEIISHMTNGWLIDDYTNPNAFTEAIDALFGQPEEALRMAKAGRAFVENDFGFEHAAARLEQLYREALRRKKTKH
ncbi:glycosyltransferase family 4 protein [Paenibacillus sp.]|uniref:glycosyltransferase family 4 protein n=1 Tax=Paenibacillus sp. TaxID=58172 RepID=UPI002D29951A|nr:glycosyltransferase family 4 protein [Paenibacillus sp.]HZG84332.1 glycosyltransferase family 4 protein [Paenibacillus sp.]